MPGFAGLRTDIQSWFLMAGMTAFWLVSVRLVPDWKRDGWPALLRSLYGLVWLDFGLDIVLRFSMLAYNAVEWGNGGLRLMALPVGTVNTTLTYCWMFWVLVVAAYAIAVRRRGTGPLAVARALTPEVAYSAAIPFALLASVIFYLAESGHLPLVLLTPLALLANFYMVPAAIVWWDHFRQPGSKRRIGTIQVLVLLPALVRGVFSPYRENLAPILLIPLIAAMFAGRRPSLLKIVPAALACLLVLSTVVHSYRLIKWQNVRAEEVVREVGEGGLSGWLTVASDEPTHRFHGFDSMLLTVALVPTLEPHSERNVLLSPLVRGVVPRFLYSGKSGAGAGIDFGSRIWAFDDQATRENPGASIAPSMPGDLYDAGGVLYIALGALIFGVLLGLVDGWKGHLPAFCGAAITVMVATQCAMSVERDFDNSIATFIQTLLVFVLVAGVVALARRGSHDYSLGFNPSLERP
jgi:hypothetical protein